MMKPKLIRINNPLNNKDNNNNQYNNIKDNKLYSLQTEQQNLDIPTAISIMEIGKMDKNLETDK